ncbi:TetR/AcrR family transcriptional regulator [Salinispira pacifica]
MSKDYEMLSRRISEEAWRLTREQGVRGWNTADLAEAAGISKRTLYKVVPSRESVLRTVVLSQIRNTQERLSAAIDAAGTVREKLEAIANEFPRLLAELDPALFRRIYREYPAIEAEVAEAHATLGMPVIRFLRTSIDAGELVTPADPETIFQMLQAFVLYFLREENDGARAVSKIGLSIRTLFNGVYPVNPGGEK